MVTPGRTDGAVPAYSQDDGLENLYEAILALDGHETIETRGTPPRFAADSGSAVTDWMIVGGDAGRAAMEAMADPDTDVAEEALLNVVASDVRAFLRRLPAAERLVMYLRYGFGCEAQTHREIAERLDIPRMRVWRIDERVLKLLRLRFGAGRVDEGDTNESEGQGCVGEAA